MFHAMQSSHATDGKEKCVASVIVGLTLKRDIIIACPALPILRKLQTPANQCRSCTWRLLPAAGFETVPELNSSASANIEFMQENRNRTGQNRTDANGTE